MKKLNYFSFRGLSLKKRLPLLICLLLLAIVIIFSWASFFGVKRAALNIAKDRLHVLSKQLSSMSEQSAAIVINASRALGNNVSIKEHLKSGGKDSAEQSLQALKNTRFDSSWVYTELLDLYGKPVLRSVRIHKEYLAPLLDSTLATAFTPMDSFKVGKIYFLNDTMYYPIITAVTDNNHYLGYLVRWKMNLANSKSVQQFAELLGAHAAFYLGNDDGGLWTNGVNSFPGAPVDTASVNNLFEYTNFNGDMVIASVQPVANTHWLILVEFSRKALLEGTYGFLKWIIIIAAILIAIGIIVTHLMSKSITAPLNKLIEATSSIAAGNYSASVEVNRNDEVGKLAHFFNKMAEQINYAQINLEKKIMERTAQLEKANKELEAFSYSVSHDLRAPLRAINGFSMILKEEYAAQLGDEANRLTDKIISNAKMMGQLIDDLIAFARLGRKDINHGRVDMNKIVHSVVAELTPQQSENKYCFRIYDLPACYADENLIRQVWVNLVSNAIKYSSKRSDPLIEIGAEKVKGVFQYYIKDNGVGFDMKYADKLFGVFQRLHNQSDFEGTGIGMALSKRIINYHNGGIWAEASPDKGATFYFSIPESNIV